MEERNNREETTARRRGRNQRYGKSRSVMSKIYVDSDPIPPRSNGNGLETNKASAGAPQPAPAVESVAEAESKRPAENSERAASDHVQGNLTRCIFLICRKKRCRN